ncbi:MAG: protein translocase subunit SecD [Candidatus Dependentiae bacterium]
MNTTAQKIFGSTLFFWVALAGFCLYYLHPLRESLRFGIDLVGGTYITLEVQAEKAIEARLLELMQTLKKQTAAANYPVQVSTEIAPVIVTEQEGGKVSSYKLIFSYESPMVAQQIATFIQEQYRRDLVVKTEAASVIIRYNPAEELRVKRDAVERNIEVIRTRIDKLGVSETPISQQGERNIIVELPDISDPQKAKAMIGKAAVLEFKLVEANGRTEEDILYELDGEIPSDMEIVPGRMVQGEVTGYYLVPRYSELTGRLLADAKGSLDERQWIVSFRWNPEGGNKFYELTSRNHGKNLAIVLDGVVITAPRISSSIRNEGRITGNFDANEAKELALLLKSGSFVAPLTFEEERQVGPSLGQESINRGLMSCLVGLGLVFIFGVFYYKVSGVFAFLALVYNLILILFGLARFGATLTLPGIAGMVLTIGMAIDASILIYERIKEELAKGMPIKTAVQQGFSNAQWVILDGNITTFIVGIVLYKFGTGPIQGFAVTMMIGIISTLITGLFFLRSIFTFILSNFKLQKLSI